MKRRLLPLNTFLANSLEGEGKRTLERGRTRERLHYPHGRGEKMFGIGLCRGRSKEAQGIEKERRSLLAEKRERKNERDIYASFTIRGEK